ncbi:MAG: CHAP domain-containing protein, partial [Oscillospiraceae bacterium]|nr:CHAP domain-containing protein [Oscillospiraceae bacterium]
MNRLIVNTPNCGVLDDWGAKQGIRYSWQTNPKPGDLVLFDFRGNHVKRDHVGIVLSSSGDIVYTVEGNTSITSNDNGGAVMRRTRYKSQITSYLRPKYDAEQTAERLMEIALSQVGVKEVPSGSNDVKY